MVLFSFHTWQVFVLFFGQDFLTSGRFCPSTPISPLLLPPLSLPGQHGSPILLLANTSHLDGAAAPVTHTFRGLDLLGLFPGRVLGTTFLIPDDRSKLPAGGNEVRDDQMKEALGGTPHTSGKSHLAVVPAFPIGAGLVKERKCWRLEEV